MEKYAIFHPLPEGTMRVKFNFCEPWSVLAFLSEFFVNFVSCNVPTYFSSQKSQKSDFE